MAASPAAAAPRPSPASPGWGEVGGPLELGVWARGRPSEALHGLKTNACWSEVAGLAEVKVEVEGSMYRIIFGRRQQLPSVECT